MSRQRSGYSFAAGGALDAGDAVARWSDIQRRRRVRRAARRACGNYLLPAAGPPYRDMVIMPRRSVALTVVDRIGQ